MPRLLIRQGMQTLEGRGGLVQPAFDLNLLQTSYMLLPHDRLLQLFHATATTAPCQGRIHWKGRPVVDPTAWGIPFMG
jgi:hypothetical protein